jgi:nicotinamide-nucleotide amidase
VTSEAQLVATCRARGLTLGTAESLTAGQISATIAAVPGCSAIFRGGIVAYDPAVKAALLGVPEPALEHVVSEAVVRAMVLGAQRALTVDLAIASTGVAGPDWLDDQPPGRVWLAAGLRGQAPLTREHDLPGDRAAVRAAATALSLALALEVLGAGISPDI